MVNPNGNFLVARNGSSNLLGISAIRWNVKKSVKNCYICHAKPEGKANPQQYNYP